MNSREKARALFFEEPGRVEVRVVDLPDRIQEGFIHVESRLIGISHGTEMLIYRGEMADAASADPVLRSLDCPMSYPLRYGYVNVGITPAGRRVFAFFPHQDRFDVADEDVVALPDDLPWEDAVFLASMETAVNACQDANPVPGETVLVAGQGVIGLLVCEVLRRSHHGPVITLDRHPMRRNLSERLGCISMDPADPQTPARIQAAAGDRGVDVAVDVSGSQGGLQMALDSLVFGGTLVAASCFGSRRINLDLGEHFHRSRLRLKSSQVSTVSPELTPRWTKARRMRLALEMIRLTRPHRYITHRFPLERAQEAYELIDRNPGESVQVVLEP
jgi:threonine dehydrogenase-like Zn-dependent dehydrogenase